MTRSPMRSWECEADGIIASRLAEIAALLGTSRAWRCGRPELPVPGGPCAPVSALGLAEAFRDSPIAISSSGASSQCGRPDPISPIAPPMKPISIAGA